MRTKWLARAAATGIAAGVLALAGTGAARADTTIGINPGNVPTTAAGFHDHDCDANFGGGPYPGQDVWVFNLPGNPGTSGHFVSVTATFSGSGGTVTKTIPTDSGAINNAHGTSKAWIALPAGWTLTGATAVISGTADFFVLTHTCPAKGSPSPTPSATHSSPTPSGSPSGTSSPTAHPSPSGSHGGPTPTASPSASSSPGGLGGESTTPGGTSSGGLPITGLPLAFTVLFGGVLLAAGASAAVLARRRRQQHQS